MTAFEKAQRATLGKMVSPSDAISAKERVEIEAAAFRIIEEVYSGFHANLDPVELCKIAIYSDINPTSIWPQHIRGFAQLFEIARFVGRLDRGCKAQLDHSILPFFTAMLCADETGLADGQRGIAAVLRTKLFQHFSADRLILATSEAAGAGTDLVFNGA